MNPLRILIVDDLAINLKLLRVQLEARGYIVVTAFNGVEALAILEREVIDVIISDILMPDMDGYRLCAEVRRNPRFQETGFIFHSATYTSPADEKLSLDLGADRFLRRPASIDELQRAIAYAVMITHRPEAATLDDKDVLKEYSERLVSKLERKNIELAEAASQLALQATALETVADAMLITDARGKIIWVNPAFTAMTGYTREDAIGNTPRLLKSGRQDDAFYRELWRTITSGQVWRGEFTNRRKDGSITYDDHTISPVRGPDGEITHYIGVMHDVTARRRAEQEATAAHAQLRQLLDRSPAVIYSLRVEGEEVTPLLASENVTEMLGFTVPETMTFEWWLGRLHPEDRERATASVADTLNRGVSNCEYRLQHKDGSYRWVDDNRRVVCDPEGNPVEIVGVWTDITEKKSLENQLLRTERLESLGTLAGGIAHDLNNLFMPILMGATLIRQFEPSERTQRIAQNIERCVKRGTDLVKQVLLFARGVAGPKVSVDLASVIAEVGSIVGSTFPKNITIRTAVAEGLPLITGDPTHLTQVLVNLCVNARDALPRGGLISVSAGVEGIDEQYAARHGGSGPGRYVVLKVVDDGFGMSQETMDRIFEPFFTTKEIGRGTGLGLSTAQGILRSHGGFMTVFSEVGKGSTFQVYLPAQAENLIVASNGPEQEILRGQGERILVVDDEKSILEITRQTLETFGYEVLTAEDGLKAIDLYQRHRSGIALVVTDMMMPVMDGATLIHNLREIDPDLPIIAVSGLSDLYDVSSIAGRAPFFLTKPFSVDFLTRTISEVLRGPAAPSA